MTSTSTWKVNLLLGLLLPAYMTLFANDLQYWHKYPVILGRGINTIQFLDINTLDMAGGYEKSDSINSIFKYIDRGRNIDIYWDFAEIRPWFTDMSFPTPDTGYVVGWNGNFARTIDTGDTWQRYANLPVSVANRHYNGLFFLSSRLGYAVGGNRENDSLQTIIKTTDGINWTVQRDVPGGWLKSVWFLNNSQGFCVGDKGTILKTTNAGAAWSTVSVSGNAGTRNFNKIIFLDQQTGFIAGGSKNETESYQTILKTTDGGNNWTVVLDAPGHSLNAVDFADTQYGYAVGDSGAIKTSIDGGSTWSDLNLPDSLNDRTRDLKAVNFYNRDLGAIGGVFGMFLVYEGIIPAPPTVATGNAQVYSNGQVKLEGTLFPDSTASVAGFEYGTSPSLGNFLLATPDSVSGDTAVSVSVLTPRLEPGVYYYRIRGINKGGSNYGETRQFYVGANPVPNFGFEFWRYDTLLTLQGGWLYAGKISRGTSYNGSISVILESDTTRITDRTGILLLGFIDKSTIIGVPFTERPDSLVFYAKYDLRPGFPGLVGMIFMNSSIPVDTFFYRIEGSSNGQFVRMSLPIVYQNSVFPDSMALVFCNNDLFSTSFNEHDSNYLEIDDIYLPGVAQNVPNPGFENWADSLVEKPVSWNTNYLTMAYRTSDAYAGNYAVRLECNQRYNAIGFISSGKDVYPQPSFPVSERYPALYAFMNYHPDGSDTAFIHISLFRQGVVIASGEKRLAATDTAYTRVEVPLNYLFEENPDSAFIVVLASARALNGYPEFVSNSYLLVDEIGFSGALDSSLITDVPVFSTSPRKLKLYPNPASGYISLVLPETEQVLEIAIVGMNGIIYTLKTIQHAFPGVLMFDVNELPPGIYLFHLRSDQNSYTGKFVISR